MVINSYAQSQLAYRTGLSSTVVPNVMKFEEPPRRPTVMPTICDAALGLQPGEFFILQPTRIVPRKRIERAMGLAVRLGLPYALVISHEGGRRRHRVCGISAGDDRQLQGARDLWRGALWR